MTNAIPVVSSNRLERSERPGRIDGAILGFTPESWLQLAAQVGPVFHVEELGRTCLCGADANAAAWRHPDDWSYARSTVGEVFQSQLGRDYITGSDGAVHRHQRKLLRPVFTGPALTQHVVTGAEILRAGFTTLADAAQHIDLHSEMILRYTLAFNRTMVDSDADDDLIRGITRFEEALVLGGSLPPSERAAWYARPAYVALRETVLGHFRSVVLARLAGQRKGDNLDLLIAAMRPASASGLDASELDIDELVRDAYLMQAGGAGNIASLFCNLLAVLHSQPAWLQRSRQECATFDAGRFAHEGMSGFPFMRAIMLEGERRFAPTPIMPKVATRDLEFLGYRIPQGLEVLHVFGLVNFIESIYPDPMRFDPERWLGVTPKRPVAFGGGEHMCLGIDVARIYGFLSLATFLREFTIAEGELPGMIPVESQESGSPERVGYRVRIAATG